MPKCRETSKTEMQLVVFDADGMTPGVAVSHQVVTL